MDKALRLTPQWTSQERIDQSYTITFTVTDKNDKSVNRNFTISFRDTGGTPMNYVDSLLNQSYTNQSDNKGTHLRYRVGSGTLTLQNRTQADGNPSEILFVYWFAAIQYGIASYRLPF
jgi:hypothetical protein